MENNLFFEPYIGINYHEPDNIIGCRLMIIGYNHDCDKLGASSVGFVCGPDCKLDAKCRKKEYTTQVIEENIFGNADYIIKQPTGWKKFFNAHKSFIQFPKVFQYYNGKEIIKFWESVAFYNYINTAIRSKGGVPSPEQFAQANKRIEYAIDLCKPDVIFIWGYKIPQANWFEEDWSKDYVNGRNCKIRLGKYDGRIPTVRITHPSICVTNLVSQSLERISEEHSSYSFLKNLISG